MGQGLMPQKGFQNVVGKLQLVVGKLQLVVGELQLVVGKLQLVVGKLQLVVGDCKIACFWGSNMLLGFQDDVGKLFGGDL